ncbi:MAG: serine--tRNA ligase [Metamycoplasmataceae bacterium]
MLDIKKIQKEIDVVIEELKKRKISKDILISLSNRINERNKIIKELSEIQHQRNRTTKEISINLENKENKEKQKEFFIKASKQKEAILKLEKKLTKMEEELKEELFYIPNILNSKVPFGNDENDNIVIFEKNKLGRGLVNNIIPHYEIATKKDILDIPRGVKISGTRFLFYKGIGARLIRALENFMLDENIKAGYEELLPPLIVKSLALKGTGQLPKFKEDVFKIENEDLYLISTSEIPITNYYNDEILNLDKPKKFTAYSPCFRSEAGSSGKDTKGLIRTHQFNKVEIVKIVNKEQAFEEFEKTILDSERILELLEIPYRKILLCSGDTGFSSSITYDLELWLPSEQRYREVSSISYFTDFQARRAKIRYKDNEGNIQIAHTINGSALAIDRVFAALLELYQNEDGTISIPEKLHPYMNGIKAI